VNGFTAAIGLRISIRPGITGDRPSLRSVVRRLHPVEAESWAPRSSGPAGGLRPGKARANLLDIDDGAGQGAGRTPTASGQLDVSLPPPPASAGRGA